MTLNKLKKLNRYVGEFYGVPNETDVQIANDCIKRYARRKRQLAAGDLIEFTNPYGDFSPRALVEKVDGDDVHVCEHGSGWCCSSKYYLSVSGGAFYTITRNQLEYVGRTKVYLKEWGHCGACRDGAIYFPVTVNLWRNKHDFKYTTKDYDRNIITHLSKEWMQQQHERYEYHNYPYGAWENNQILSAWCVLHKAFITKEDAEYANKDSRNAWHVWTSKLNKEHYWLEDEEVLKMKGVHDYLYMNGSIRNVCFVYNGTSLNVYYGKGEIKDHTPYENSLDKVYKNNIHFPESFIQE